MSDIDNKSPKVIAEEILKMFEVQHIDISLATMLKIEIAEAIQAERDKTQKKEAEIEEIQGLYEKNIDFWQRRCSEKVERIEKLEAVLKDALTCDQYSDHSSGSWQIGAEELGIMPEKDDEL